MKTFATRYLIGLFVGLAVAVAIVPEGQRTWVPLVIFFGAAFGAGLAGLAAKAFGPAKPQSG